MIEIGITEDIRKFEPTAMGFLTTRQLIAVMAGGIPSFLIITSQMKAGISPAENPIWMIFAIPAGLMGWAKFFGLPFEKFFIRVIWDNFINPKQRVLATDNFYNVLYRDMIKQDAAPKKTTKKKRNVISALSVPPELRAYPERFPARHKKSASQTIID